MTGELTLKKAFESDLSNAEYKLVLVATDGGFPPLSQEVELPVTVVNKAMPVFDKPFYGVTVREDVAVSTSILGINASSPEGQVVIFTIIDGDPSFQFDIGFDTGTISVIYPLDYETTQYYRLTVKATDTQTGARSEVDVDVVVLDVNDNPPLFQNTSYSAVLPENSMIGTTVLKVGNVCRVSPLFTFTDSLFTPVTNAVGKYWMQNKLFMRGWSDIFARITQWKP